MKAGRLPWATGFLAKIKAEPRPAILRYLSALLIVSVFFDWLAFSRYILTDNAASVIGLILVFFFVVSRSETWTVTGHAQVCMMAFIVINGTIAIARTFTTADTSFIRLYLQYFQVVVLYFIFVDLFRDPRVVRLALKTFLGCALVMSSLAHLNLFGQYGMARGIARTGVIGLDLNFQGSIYAMILVAMFARLLTKWPDFRKYDLIHVPICLMLFSSMLQTGSRGAGSLFFSGIALACVFQYQVRRLSNYFTIIPVALFLTAIFIFFGNSALHERFEKTIEEGDTGHRYELAQASMTVFMKNPIIGVGATYPKILGKAKGIDRPIAAHNAYLQMLLSFGIVGVIPWFLGLLFIVRSMWFVRKTPLGGVVASILFALFVYGAVANLGYNKIFWILLALATDAQILALFPTLNWDVMKGLRQAKNRLAPRPARPRFSRIKPGPIREPQRFRGQVK